MEAIHSSLWSVPADMKLGGWLALNTRMTVIRLSSGGLVLHSPVAYTPALGEAVDALGTVQAIIAPSLFHHLYIGDWMSQYPEAQSYAAPGLDKKRPELRFTHPLGEEFDATYGEELQRIPIRGMPKVHESLFFHPESGVLIATDFAFFMPEATGLTGLYASLMRFKKQVHTPFLFRLGIQDKEAFRQSLVPLRRLPVQQLSMCHHYVLSEGANAALHAVLDWLGVPPDSA